ncbi:MAG TPA: hypothetical protein VFF13_00490 [archaeon]|nr:hypothetical protein [archaeon]
MEHNIMNKGQASVEFLLILLLSILYISTAIIPGADAAGNAAEDTAGIAKLVGSAEKLSGTIQYVSLSGEGTRQTIEIVVPENSTFTCTPIAAPNSITISYTAKRTINAPGKCTTDNPSVCTKTINVGTTFTCNPVPAAPALYKVTVEKIEAGTSSRVEATFEQI